MEITGVTQQTVGSNQDVLFTATPIEGNCSIMHREGSGLTNLRGITNGQCRARYRVTFGGNVAIPTTGTAGPITIAITIDGEPVGSATMISTPGAVNLFNNIAASIFIDVPKGCCTQVTIRNVTSQAIVIQNANLIAERVA
jgi:hypothetical protein